MILHHIRTANHTSSTTTKPNIIAALLFIRQQFVTIVQHTATHLHGSDLLLVPTFLQGQLQQAQRQQRQQVLQAPHEVWVPLCLPRLYSSGYVHCYATHIPVHCPNDDDDDDDDVTAPKNQNDNNQTGLTNTTTANNNTQPTATTTHPNPAVAVTLCLISTIGTTEEFQLLRSISQRIGQSMDHDETITAYEDCHDEDDDANNQIRTQTNHPDDAEDYELIASFSDISSTFIESMNHNNNNHSNNTDRLDNNCQSSPNEHNPISFRSVMWKMMIDMSTRQQLSLRWENWIKERYLQPNNGNNVHTHSIVIRHFVFRIHVPTIPNFDMNDAMRGQKARYRQRNSQNWDNSLPDGIHPQNSNHHGHLVQCICSSYDCCHVTNGNQRHQPKQQHQSLWNMYHKLQLRLRCGSSNCNAAMRYIRASTSQPMDSGNHNNNNNCNNNDSRSRNNRLLSTSSSLESKPTRTRVQPSAPTQRPTSTINDDCPMILLSESLPTIDGMTYVTENNSITYLAMNGNGFELYVVHLIILSLYHFIVVTLLFSQ
jgi:hypothetical protein